jgi:hypothetical protein
MDALGLLLGGLVGVDVVVAGAYGGGRIGREARWEAKV